MSINQNYANELTVGINFFENIPPVIIKDDLSLLRRSTELPYVDRNMEGRQTKQRNKKLNDIVKKTMVKGFGGTALFTAGLVMTSKDAGDCIRLDDRATKQNILHNSEEICKRNPTIVRKYYNQREIASENISCRTKEDEDIGIPSDFRDDIFASDYRAKSGNLKKILEVDIQ